MGHPVQAAHQTHHQAALQVPHPAAHREPAVHRLFSLLLLAHAARRRPPHPAKGRRPQPSSK